MSYSIKSGRSYCFAFPPRWGLDARYKAARRALGLVNQLSPGPSKAYHASRVMSNLNRLRSEYERRTHN